MNLLPHWVLTDKFPAFYDSESKTAIEQTARVYGAMQELITEYNSFVDSVNQHITDFENAAKKDYEIFTTAIRQEFQDFIDVVTLKIQSQDSIIADAVSYMKTNLSESIDAALLEMRASGGFSQEVLKVYADMENQIAALNSRMNTFTTLEEGSTTGDAELQDGRIDYTGKTWDNIGAHIRGVTSELSSEIAYVNDSVVDFSGYFKYALKYGNIAFAFEPTYTDTKQFLHVIIDTKAITENVVAKSFDSAIGTPRLYSTAFDENGNVLFDSGGWSDITIGKVIAKPYSAYAQAYPNTRYMGATIAFMNNGEWLTEIPLNSVTIVNNSFIKDINSRLLEVETAKKVNVACIVDKNGKGDYTTISEAIDNTKQGDTILIMPAIYEEQIQMWGRERYLVGLNRDTTIIRLTNTLYGEEPIQANIGGLYNLTVIAGYGFEPIENDTVGRCYALHVEFANDTPYTLYVENCNLISTVNYAVGMGVRHNQSVIFKNCLMETKAKTVYSSYYGNIFVGGGLFIHNDNTAENLGNDGYVSVENCELKGVRSALCLQSQNNGNELKLRFVNSLAWSTENGKAEALYLRTTPTEGHICGSDLVLDGVSFGNNIDELNA